MAQQENPGIIGTVMSYIPGYGTQPTEELISSDKGASSEDTTGASGFQSTTGQHSTVNQGGQTTEKDTNTGTGSSTHGEGTGTQYSDNPTHQANTVTYEDDDTGTHHSGYNPRSASQESHGQREHQARDDGVRGAPIEGDGVKGYAIGAPVGSGDTEKPNQPGDPSGQVSGAHVEYGPKETDTRDGSGRGTLANSEGKGDSSFANVKTDDGRGNSSHVMTRSNESHMHSTSVTQM